MGGAQAHGEHACRPKTKSHYIAATQMHSDAISNKQAQRLVVVVACSASIRHAETSAHSLRPMVVRIGNGHNPRQARAQSVVEHSLSSFGDVPVAPVRGMSSPADFDVFQVQSRRWRDRFEQNHPHDFAVGDSLDGDHSVHRVSVVDAVSIEPIGHSSAILERSPRHELAESLVLVNRQDGLEIPVRKRSQRQTLGPQNDHGSVSLTG